MDDISVSRLRTPVKTSAVYLLFYNSLQKVWVLLLVPMVLLFCGERFGVGGELLGVYGWGGGCWMGRDGGLMPGLWWGWWMADECELSSALVLSLCFPTPSVPVFALPIGPIISLPYFPYPFVPLFPTIMTLMHPRRDAESCCSMSHPVAGCWSLPQSVSDLSARLSQGRLVGYNELQWERCLKDLLVHPRRHLKKKKKKSDKCINRFIQLNLELLNTGTVHSLRW